MTNDQQRLFLALTDTIRDVLPPGFDFVFALIEMEPGTPYGSCTVSGSTDTPQQAAVLLRAVADGVIRNHAEGRVFRASNRPVGEG